MTTRRRPPEGGHAGVKYRFWAVAVGGSLASALACALAPVPVQLALLGAAVSTLAGLLLAGLYRQAERDGDLRRHLDTFGLPLELAPHHGLYAQYRAFADAFAALAAQSDPTLHEFALLKLASLAEQVQSLAQGKVVFHGTEAWRTVYERLLTSPDVKRYHSAAWVRTADYWRDQPGRQSMGLNFRAVERGVRIERAVILPAALWPAAALLPTAEVRPWVQEQHDRGVWVYLVREEDLRADPDLLCDFGVYGGRAAGTHELDESGRTVRFTLHFDRLSLQLAAQRWERLLLYAKSYSDLLDQTPPAGYEH